MGKGEIARYEQFLLFPQSFQKACFPGASKGVTVWEWVNQMTNFKFHPNENILQKTISKHLKKLHFNIDREENIVEKGENAGFFPIMVVESQHFTVKGSREQHSKYANCSKYAKIMQFCF